MAVLDTSTFTVKTTQPVAGDRAAVFLAGIDKPEMMDRARLGIKALKTATETRTATTTLANDAVLLFPMLANMKYRFIMELFYATTLGGDFKYRHVGPAAPTLISIIRDHMLNSATAKTLMAMESAYSAADVSLVSGAATGGWIQLKGVVHNGVNAGNFAFQWAQDTSDAGNTSVLAGSFLEYQLVG